MDVEKFKLLMWKNYRLRRFHWIMTLVEIVLPILVAYALTQITANLSDHGKSNTFVIMRPPSYPPAKSRSEMLQNVHTHLLVYAPSNTFTDSLMQNVNKTLSNLNFCYLCSLCFPTVRFSKIEKRYLSFLRDTSAIKKYYKD